MMSNSKRLRTTALIAAIATIGLTLNVRQSANHFQRRTSADLVPEAVAKHIGDVTSPVNDADTAVFWHIPKDSGSSVKSYYLCMGLVVASNESEEEGHGSDTVSCVFFLILDDHVFFACKYLIQLQILSLFPFLYMFISERRSKYGN
uniref:Uncharacterized protein n=1 Tax=Ditylum brightwellii TaxID=49249 RepID=A0A7S4W9E8_9STRA|mmetsp:Transcript_21818/g.29012  ORF Transcript_21818/g.29012 Transcript_21818/m.29012 type:complete len:147 (+) Transcript_21818:62-502(+)